MDEFSSFLEVNSRARQELSDVRIDCGLVQGKFGVDMA